jgi:hypothetical protein
MPAASMTSAPTCARPHPDDIRWSRNRGREWMRPKRHKSSAISERRELLEEGKYRSAAEIADAEGVTRSFVNRMMRLTLLAPDIVEAILEGRQPKAMQLEELTGLMPNAWEQQHHQKSCLPLSKPRSDVGDELPAHAPRSRELTHSSP